MISHCGQNMTIHLKVTGQGHSTNEILDIYACTVLETKAVKDTV